MTLRVHFVGVSEALLSALRDGMPEAAVTAGWPKELGNLDVVVLEAGLGRDAVPELPGGDVYPAVCALKGSSRAAVWVVIPPDDAFGPEIARFCLADGVLRWAPGQPIDGLRDLAARNRGHDPKVSVDALLKKLEAGMANNDTATDSALRRLMEQEHEDSLLDHITDSETGLYNGPFASFKLDEEFKRSVRFHQPLGLVLLDVGLPEGALPSEPNQRAAVWAEIASVFLNECRDIDTLARFTESIFLFLLPGTGHEGSKTLTRRHLDTLAAKTIAGVGALTPRAGLAVAPDAAIPDRRTFLGVAEECLLMARESADLAGGLVTSFEQAAAE